MPAFVCTFVSQPFADIKSFRLLLRLRLTSTQRTPTSHQGGRDKLTIAVQIFTKQFPIISLTLISRWIEHPIFQVTQATINIPVVLAPYPGDADMTDFVSAICQNLWKQIGFWNFLSNIVNNNRLSTTIQERTYLAEHASGRRSISGHY